MTENIVNVVKKYGKEMVGYGNEYNFIGESEIPVTITLAEYRNLVRAGAEAEKQKALSENYELRREIDSLNKKVSNLLDKIAELTNTGNIEVVNINGERMDKVGE